MMAFRPFTPEEAIGSATAALSRSWGASVAIHQAVSLGGEARRNLVLRAAATADGLGPRPIIIKATRAASYDAGAADAYTTSGFVKEWAASRYLARHAPGQTFSPALLAYDLERGVLVYDDVGASAASLVGPLLHGTAREAEQALSAYALALAGLHRATIGCRDGHSAIIGEGLPSSALPPPAQRWVEDVARVPHALLGGEFAAEEAEVIAERLKRPGCWEALVHGDPCPDNILLPGDGRAMLIDFEFARPGHALLDAAYWRMGFPTCWCAGTIPAEVAQRIERRYRAAIQDDVAEARDDDAFRRERAMIDFAWLFGNLAWLLEGALAGDGKWGRATNRSRIMTYLQRAILSATETDVLPGLCSLAASWQDELGLRWPDAAPLPEFPAFSRAGE